MRKWKSKVGVALAVLAVVQLAGCGKITKLTLLKKVSEQMADAESYAMNMKMALEAGGSVSGITVDMGMDMDLDMDVNQDPQIVHSTGVLAMEALGQSQDIPLEMYVLEENGKSVVYAGSNGTWTKEEGEDFSRMAGTLGAEQYLAMAESVELAEETEDVEGQECYVLSGTIEGEVLESAMGTMMEAFEESGLLDDLDFTEVQIPVELYIGKKDSYPVQMSMDMKSIMGEALGAAASQNGVEFTCDTCTMEIGFSSFNQVGSIEVPQEVISQSTAA